MATVIVAVLFLIIGFILGSMLMAHILGEKAVYYKQLAEKHLEIMDVFKRWLMMLENGGSIEAYFMENGYKKIAIYGMGYLGERLLKGLSGTDIEVKYVIDRQYHSVDGEISVVSMNDILEPVDVIVVTPIYYFYTIKKQLKERTADEVISIENIFR